MGIGKGAQRITFHLYSPLPISTFGRAPTLIPLNHMVGAPNCWLLLQQHLTGYTSNY